jgi:xanthine/uracil/vitamin C permease (AzgA family)
MVATRMRAGSASGRFSVEAGTRAAALRRAARMLCFALTLFFSPFVAAIPPQAYGPALIVVGLLMLAPITRASALMT